MPKALRGAGPETRVQVLHEPDKPPQSNSYMWVQRGGPMKKPIILFHYDSSRSSQVPLRLLDGYQGSAHEPQIPRFREARGR